MSPTSKKAGSSASSWKTIVVDVTDESIPEEELILIYRWLDGMKFSRSKKTSTHRDFADGVMMAELVSHHIPKLVDLVNYIPGSASARKRENWELLNTKVFKKIKFQVTPELIKKVANAEPGMIEHVLYPLRAILSLGPLAAMPPAQRLEHVKSKFVNVQRQFNNLGGSQNKHPSRPASAGSRPFSALATSRDSETSVTAQMEEIPPTRREGRDPLGSSKSSRSEKKMQSGTPPISEQSSATDTAMEDDGNNTRPSTANSSPPTRTQASRHLPRHHASSRPQSANPSYMDRDENDNIAYAQSKPKSGGNGKVLNESEESSRPHPERRGSGNRKNRNDDEEIYDEIYCDSAPKENRSEDEEEYSCEEEVSQSQRKMKRVRKYEYREDYILNGTPVGSTAYSLPLTQQELGSRSIESKYIGGGIERPGSRQKSRGRTSQ